MHSSEKMIISGKQQITEGGAVLGEGNGIGKTNDQLLFTLIHLLYLCLYLYSYTYLHLYFCFSNYDISTTGLLLQSEAYLKFWHIYSRVLSAQARIKH